jgi:hypothetical protein
MQLEALEHETHLAARAAPRASSSSMANRSWPASRTVPLVGVSSPAMMDSSVLLPEPDAPTMATVSRWRQREIDIAQNVQRAGGIGDRLANVFNRNDYFTHGALFGSTTLYRAWH